MSSQSLPGDPEITRDILREHKISDDEYARIEASLGRKPTFTELGVFSVMWSEHCSYKSSRVHLKRLPTEGPRVIQGPGENAGVVDIGDGFCAVFKMESHNHPSFIEPYQGAATGVGGILRDVFTMGARPIASLNSLRFGRPDHKRTPELLRGVVAGIGGYGNCIGVPTVGGEVQFDEAYDGNILVNAFTCGVARTDRLFFGRAAGVGNPILYVGTKTGRDGIHGATMASDNFGGDGGEGEAMGTASSIKKGIRSTMQVGDPFMEKLLLEACLELFATDCLEGIQDMGAAGLTSSSVEMAGRAGSGLELWLDAIPRRARAMRPYELLLSESQERMLMVAKKGREQEVIDHCKRWELDCAIVGVVTDTGRWVVTATPGYDPLEGEPNRSESVVVCDLPVGALTDDAPVYDRPRAPLTPRPVGRFSPVTDLGKSLLALVGSPNLGSRQWITRQYDCIVRGGTVVRPGSDAAVVRVPCEKDGKTTFKYLAFSADCNGRHVALSPFEGGKMTVAEACRNLVCAGAEPIGLTDCLNFANPEVPVVAEELATAIDGLAEACRALEVPIVSGNVSLYNETTAPDGSRLPILPTPTIGAVGQIAEPEHITTQWLKREGDIVMLLGSAACEGLGGSEYAAQTGTGLTGPAPTIDLAAEAKLQRVVLGLIRDGVVSSAHDVSSGGLAVALAECSISAPDDENCIGIVATIDSGPNATAALFGEAPSRIVISVAASNEEKVRDAATRAGIACVTLGKAGGRRVVLTCGALGCDVPVDALRSAHRSCLESIVGT